MFLRISLWIVLLALGTAAFGPALRAEIVRVDGQGLAGKVVQPPHAPERGMSKARVVKQFGPPMGRTAPVGDPPISSWKYPGYRVYFERDRVIHAVTE